MSFTSIWIDAYSDVLRRGCSVVVKNQIHGQMVVSGLCGDDYMISNLIDSLFTPPCANPDLASLVFSWRSRVPASSGVLSWTSMIRGYSYSGYFRESILFYARMKLSSSSSSSPINNFNLPFALKSCAALKALTQAHQIHTDILKLGFVSNVFVQTSLLDMYVKCARIESAKQVFDNMAFKTVVSWTAIIAGYCRHGLLDHAQKLFHQMPLANIVTWNAMVDGLSRYGSLDLAQWYFDHMPQRNTVSWTIMIGGYSRVGNLNRARWLFDQMVDREVIAWTAMMTCYIQNAKPAEAIMLFNQMLEADMKPDRVTVLTLISAVSQLGSLHLCPWIENCISAGDFKSDLHILNAAINMYVQCGSIDEAFDIFRNIPKKDIISYNSMITGFATHGYAKRAFSLFSTMTKDYVLPNSITFISLLSACAHGGLVEEGRRYFRLLLDAGYVELKPEHYACTVDLLGRAGHLDEAHNLILDMPIKPDASTWGALLGACSIHGNISLGEVIAQKLFEMEPDNSGNYAILANMYVNKKMWDSAANVRRVMKERSLFKTPGSSWAEMNNALVGNQSM